MTAYRYQRDDTLSPAIQPPDRGYRTGGGR